LSAERNQLVEQLGYAPDLPIFSEDVSLRADERK
jgi:hypothetical protein